MSHNWVQKMSYGLTLRAPYMTIFRPLQEVLSMLVKVIHQQYKKKYRPILMMMKVIPNVMILKLNTFFSNSMMSLIITTMIMKIKSRFGPFQLPMSLRKQVDKKE